MKYKIEIREHPANATIRAQNEINMLAGRSLSKEITDVQALFLEGRQVGWLNLPAGREPGMVFFQEITPEVEADFRREAEKITGRSNVKAGHAPPMTSDNKGDDDGDD